MSDRFEFPISDRDGRQGSYNGSWHNRRMFRSRQRTKPRTARKRRDEPLMKIIRRSTLRSSFVGLSKIAASTSRLGRWVWSVITLTCVIGFLYQALKFVLVYQDLPTEVTLRVENNGTVEFPAVTVCNNNRIRKSEYCKHHAQVCSSADGRLKLSESQIFDAYFEALTGAVTWHKFQLGHTLDNLIKGCVFNGMIPINASECLSRFVPYFDPDYGSCFTFQAADRGGSMEDLSASEADFWDDVNDLVLLLDQESEEWTEGGKRHVQHGMSVTVHANDHNPDLHTDSIQIEGGSLYSFAVEQSVTMLLPSPYKTNCTDFEDLPWVSEQAIPSSRMCTVGCSLHFQLRSCGYVTRNLSLFYEELPWDVASVTDANEECAASIEESTKGYCRSLCGVPCEDVQFEVAVGKTALQKSEVSDFVGYNLDTDPKWDDLIIVRVFYKTIERKVYEHSRMYDDLELFSYLGGYSGVWLGFSLLNLCEMLEIVLLSLKHALWRCKDRTTRAGKVNAKMENKIKMANGEVKQKKISFHTK